MNAWIVRSNPNPSARLRLFCFPHAGGGALAIRNWSRQLPSDIEVLVVQPPGREERIGEPAFDRLAPLVEAAAAALAPYLDLPYAFFGHSFGALVAFEAGAPAASIENAFARSSHRLGPPGADLSAIRPSTACASRCRADLLPARFSGNTGGNLAKPGFFASGPADDAGRHRRLRNL